ncbi:MAG TPA: FAD-binding oxidoreductase [Roseiflexaceae bacterium]|nr:FAD-binding oxidoreductase [Roseiflexaceae bacterium]
MSEQASTQLLNALASIVPADSLISDRDACARYAVQGVVPGCVVAPGSVEELGRVMQVATALHAATVSWGGGTQQMIGNAPQQIDLLVRTERLNRVLIHEPDDLTISVEAGMTMQALRTHLSQQGQMLPLDPPLPDRATIGGLIATATDGPRRLGYGTLRDLLIGIAVVEASGRVSRGGGMVVKNVSGFDMMKLYLGSFGTLAIIVSANFKLLPLPRFRATQCCRFQSAEAAWQFADALHGSQLTPTAAEYLNASALAAIGMDGACGMLARAEGIEAAVERHMRELNGLAARYGAAVERRDDDADLWARVADLPQTADIAHDEAVIKTTTLPSDTAAAIERLEAWGRHAGCAPIISARALNGVIYARLRPVVEAGMSELAAMPGVRWIAAGVPHGPRWGAAPSTIATMQRIKQEFDPLHVLNPGRFVVGM